MVVLLALVIAGIVIAVRAKTGTGKGCGIVMAIAFVLQAGLVDLLREKLTAPKAEAPASISVNGRTAVRQIVRGEIDRLRVTYRITYFEGKNDFYRVFCWTLESKAAAFAGDLDKVAESFREKVVAQDADHS